MFRDLIAHITHEEMAASRHKIPKFIHTVWTGLSYIPKTKLFDFKSVFKNSYHADYWSFKNNFINPPLFKLKYQNITKKMFSFIITV